MTSTMVASSLIRQDNSSTSSQRQASPPSTSHRESPRSGREAANTAQSALAALVGIKNKHQHNSPRARQTGGTVPSGTTPVNPSQPSDGGGGQSPSIKSSQGSPHLYSTSALFNRISGSSNMNSPTETPSVERVLPERSPAAAALQSSSSSSVSEGQQSDSLRKSEVSAHPQAHPESFAASETQSESGLPQVMWVTRPREILVGEGPTATTITITNLMTTHRNGDPAESMGREEKTSSTTLSQASEGKSTRDFTPSSSSIPSGTKSTHRHHQHSAELSGTTTTTVQEHSTHRPPTQPTSRVGEESPSQRGSKAPTTAATSSVSSMTSEPASSSVAARRRERGTLDEEQRDFPLIVKAQPNESPPQRRIRQQRQQEEEEAEREEVERELRRLQLRREDLAKRVERRRHQQHQGPSTTAESSELHLPSANPPHTSRPEETPRKPPGPSAGSDSKVHSAHNLPSIPESARQSPACDRDTSPRDAAATVPRPQQQRVARRVSSSSSDSSDSFERFKRERAKRMQDERCGHSSHPRSGRAGSPPLFELERTGRGGSSKNGRVDCHSPYTVPPRHSSHQSSEELVKEVEVTAPERTSSKQPSNSYAARTFHHAKTRQEMQEDFDRRSKEHHTRFLRLCGRLSKKRGSGGKSGTFNSTCDSFNGTFDGTFNGASGNCPPPVTPTNLLADPHNASLNRTNHTFNQSCTLGPEANALATALKDLPISEDTIGNTNRDEELQYAAHILPLVEEAAKDEDGDPMVFGLGTIGLVNRERQRHQELLMSAGPNAAVQYTTGEDEAPKNVFERLRHRPKPTAVSMAVVKEKQKLLQKNNFHFTNGGEDGLADMTDEQVMSGGQRAFTMTEFLTLQRLVKGGYPLQTALEAMKRLTRENDMARERIAQEAAEEAEATAAKAGRQSSPLPMMEVGSRPTTNGTIPGSSRGVESRDKVRNLRLPEMKDAGGHPHASHLNDALPNPRTKPAVSLPKPPPPPPLPGGVMDTFGYFPTHRVQPLYYHQLEGSSSSNHRGSWTNSLKSGRSGGQAGSSLSSNENLGADGTALRHGSAESRRQHSGSFNGSFSGSRVPSHRSAPVKNSRTTPRHGATHQNTSSREVSLSNSSGRGSGRKKK